MINLNMQSIIKEITGIIKTVIVKYNRSKTTCNELRKQKARKCRHKTRNKNHSRKKYNIELSGISFKKFPKLVTSQINTDTAFLSFEKNAAFS